MKAVTEADRARFCEIYDLYLDGLSLREISQKVGISHEGVRQLLRRASTAEEYKVIKAASDRRRMRTWQTTEAMALLDAGNSCAKVAGILKISVSAVKRLSTQYNKIKRSRT
jgi:DNA-binding CsgD family transcriptional regulator